MLFCVLPVCYDVRLSHLNKEYLLTRFNAEDEVTQCLTPLTRYIAY